MSDDRLAFPPEHAPRMIFVFALDCMPEELPAWEPDGAGDDWPLPEALGLGGIAPEHVEVFPVARIADYGLARYLAEAHGMSAERVEDEAQALQDIAGLVVLVHGRAVAGRDGAFAPKPPARFIARVGEQPMLAGAVPPPSPRVTRGVIAGGSTSGDTPGFPWRGLGLGLVGLVLLAAYLWSLA